jgi:hypothetical protein
MRTLSTFAARNAQGADYHITELARLKGVRAKRAFQAGPRKYLVVPKTQDSVLILDAFPANSSRIDIFDSILATLELR